MSINKYLKINEVKEEIDNKTPAVFIQVIGSHGSGKSATVGKIKEKYGNKIKVLGKYSESNTTKGIYTGGMDAISGTNTKRFEIIKNAFLSNKKVVICEGFMVLYYSSFLSKYYELQEIRNRDVYIIYLTADIDVLVKRIEKRSKGKKTTEKRYNKVKSIMKTSESGYNKLTQNDRFKLTKFDVSKIEFYKDVIDYISNIIERYL